MEVQLIDVMGDDLRVANAARVSFHKESYEFTLRKDVEKGSDEGLIEYLAGHNHWTPFSHVMITMREKVPIFIARQRFKHTVGFSYNEVSRRYVDDPPEFFVPDEWRSAPDNAKQGSGNKIVKFLTLGDDHNQIRPLPVWMKGDGRTKGAYEKFIKIVEEYYQELIDSDVAPEQARMVLPQSMYTEYIVTGSLPAWARAYKLRIDSHAQKEIQDLAKMWGNVIGNLEELKYSWKALTTQENK